MRDVMNNKGTTYMKGALPLMWIIGVIIAVVIVAVAAVALSNHGTINSTTTAQTTSVTTTGSATTSTSGGGNQYSAGYTNATCGPGNYCLSRSEMASTVGGTGGNYSAIYASKQTYFASIFAAAGSNANQTAVFNNITGMYLATYNQSNTTSATGAGSVTLEFIFQGAHAQWIYRNLIRNESSGWNVTNATLNGLTYSYSGASVSGYGGSPGFASTYFVGYKNQGAVMLLSLGAKLDQTKLATAVAGDIP